MIEEEEATPQSLVASLVFKLMPSAFNTHYDTSEYTDCCASSAFWAYRALSALAVVHPCFLFHFLAFPNPNGSYDNLSKAQLLK